MGKISTYLKLSRDELRKVVWPSRQLTIQHTLLVIGLSLTMAAFLGSVDYLFSKLLELLV